MYVHVHIFGHACAVVVALTDRLYNSNAYKQVPHPLCGQHKMHLFSVDTGSWVVSDNSKC